LRRAEHHHYPESRGAEFIKEGTAFLGAGDSCEPICLVAVNFRRKRFAQYKFSSVDAAFAAEHASQFAEDCRPRRVQIENTVN
jgi:hypothetical protein